VNDWQSPKVCLPPQGVKIIWFKKGDIFIAQRIGHKYLCMQPGEGVILEEPQLWIIAPLPPPYEGMIKVMPKGSNKLISVDDFENEYPKEYKEFVESIKPEKWK